MPRKIKRNQKGGNKGAVNTCNQHVNIDVHRYAPTLSQSEQAFSARYFTGAPASNNQYGQGYYLDVSANRVGGLPEVQAVFDPKPPVTHPKTNALQEYPKPSFCSTQTGGEYNFITNPETGRKVKVNGKKGREIIQKYLVQQGGAEGLQSNFDANMVNREFGCRQPDWSPNCV